MALKARGSLNSGRPCRSHVIGVIELIIFMMMMMVCSVDWPLELPVFDLVPSTSQVVFEGDRFPLECHVAESDVEMNVTWIHDSEAVKTDRERGLLLHARRLPDRTRVTTLVIERLSAEKDTGNWTCHVATALGTSELSIELVVLSRKTIYCRPEVTYSNRGQYVWPSTIAGMEQMIPCIAGGAPDLDKSVVASARRVCDDTGNWKDADVGQCRYISRTTQTLEDYLLVRTYAENMRRKLVMILCIRSHMCVCC